MTKEFVALIWQASNIRVAVRCRPFSAREQAEVQWKRLSYADLAFMETRSYLHGKTVAMQETSMC